ncbi:unnamed protein product [Calypogeia fissa]
MGIMEQRLWLLAFMLGFLFVGMAFGDAGVVVEGEEIGVGSGGDKVAPLIREIERLKEKVATLDSSLEKKEAHISVVEKELAVLKEQKAGHGGEKETLSKLERELDSMAFRVRELEDQMHAATKDSEQANKYAQALTKRAESAEETVRDLTAKLEKSRSSLSASKKHAADVEKTLKNAEKDIAEAETRLKAHGEELSRVHNQWLPPWAASQFAILQSRAKAKWSSHAKPQVDALYKQASKKAGEAHAFVRPHLDRAASTVGPEVRKHWKTVTDSVSPHVELVRSKSSDGYEYVRKEYLGKAQEFLEPHYKTVVETTRPYVTLVQEKTRPYVDQISTASKPYLDHARKFVNPYLEKASPYYRDAISAALKHHENLQEAVRKNLSKTELAASILTQELVWFLASALLALPVLIALLIFSSAFGGKKTASRRPKRNSPTGSSASSGAPGSKPKRSKKADK